MQKEYLLISIAAILYGTITVGGKFFSDLGLSSYEISLYSGLWTTIILLLIVLFNRKYLIKKEMLPLFLTYGLIGASTGFIQYIGIILGVPVAIVALLLYSQPIWTTIFGQLLLKEEITRRKVGAVMVAIFGVFLLVKPWDIKTVGPVAGIISALLGGMFLALWVIWGRKSGLNKQHYITTNLGLSVFSTFWLLLLRPIITLFIHQQSLVRLSTVYLTRHWFYLLIFSLISFLIPHSLFFKGIQKVQASIAGILLLLEPVSATILAAILFNQPITLNILLGGVLILLSNYLIVGKK